MKMDSVSIIIPCFNEEKTIKELLMAIYAQSYPKEAIEVIISDGMSVDGTRRKIAEFMNEYRDLNILIVDNPHRNIPKALNLAIEKSTGKWLIRLDAHCKPAPDYLERSVSDLEANLGENVGGIWEIVPSVNNWIGRSIAAAASHPLGVGDAQYRFTKKAQFVDTVPFGAFHRQLIDKIGGFNETLLSNEDYEFNTRIKENGGRIWLNPNIRSTYFARSTIRELARQYWRYGFWKWQMLKRHPKTIRWRQALPPVFVTSIIINLVMAPFIKTALILLFFELLVYFIILVIGALPIMLRNKDARLIIGIPLSIATMHICWGAGFLWSMVSFRKK